MEQFGGGVQYGINDNLIEYTDPLYGSEAGLVDPNLLQPTTGEMGDHEYIEQDDGDFQMMHQFLVDGVGSSVSVTSVHLDHTEELIWAGTSEGRVTSYFSSTETSRYTSFQVHKTDEIRDIWSISTPGVLCLTPTTLNLRTRYGLPTFGHTSPNFQNMQTLCYIPQTSRLLIGGHQNSIVEFDLDTKKEVKAHILSTDPDDPGDSVILRYHPRFIIHGEKNGSIALHDPRSMRQEHRFKPHHAGLCDFDVQGNFIASCGFTTRMGAEVSEPLFMIYDMRMMKLGIPVRCKENPYLFRFLPNFSSSIAMVTVNGIWNVIDIMRPDTALYMFHNDSKQVNLIPSSAISSMSMSASSQVVAFGDTIGQLHIWAQPQPVINTMSVESPYPSTMEETPSIPITDQFTPLGSVPLEIPNTSLLSDWPTELMSVKYRPTPRIDPNILANMNMQGPVGYHPNNLGHTRNVIPYEPFKRRRRGDNQDKSSGNCNSKATFKVPLRYRRLEIKYNKLGMDDFDFDMYNRTNCVGLDLSLPNSYCNPMIQMFYYLSPLRATLLSHLCSREYCLACELGFLFHMMDISGSRGAGHQGMPCNAANFLRAFRTIPEVSAMGLLLIDAENRATVNLGAKIMSWNCFVLQQIKTELQADIKEKAEIAGNNSAEDSPSLPPTPPNAIDSVFGCDIQQSMRCSRCNHEDKKDSGAFMQVLNVNEVMPELYNELNCSSIPFSKVLEASMCKASTTQAWCEECNKYSLQQNIRTFKTLPNTLVVNMGLENTQALNHWKDQQRFILNNAIAENEKAAEGSSTTDAVAGDSSTTSATAADTTDAFPVTVPLTSRPCRYKTACTRPDCKFWHPGRNGGPLTQPQDGSLDVLTYLETTQEHSWLPLAMRAKLNEDGTIALSEIDINKIAESKDTEEEGIIYDLTGVVSLISDPRLPDKNNLVATIKVGKMYHEKAGVSSVEHWYIFNDISIAPISASEAVWFPQWKVPCVLYWARRNMPPALTDMKPVNPITKGVLKSDVPVSGHVTFVPLIEDEIPGKDDIVAMDAEFVNLKKEEAEIRSDGTRSTVKPSHKSVARITCIRGQGSLKETPFMDDYISTTEQVVDYLTKFSGINPGDLDANYSQKHLTHLKNTYIKLRYLVDQGVKFVGHGLKNDFRVINMVVPPSQLIDTLHLFHMPHNRMLSLKFLAWHFLNIKIQAETHDSVEDSRTALLLYEKYLEFTSHNILKEELHKVYDVGKKLNYNVPAKDGPE